ncbi:sporulation integral membrane protein YtvI [Marinicrinis sediminis]|uniref:Sporulation integral membrane protein YtvI n=1 Tax=Marinicrinis sediminis TaxID=1652465 RepID=A0ABW5RCU4_9BACL
MFTFYRKYSRTAFDIGLIILTVFLIMWLFSFLYAIAAPIFLAFVIFFIIEPLARALNRKGMKKSLATGISMLLFVLLILGSLLGAGIIFVKQTETLAQNFPNYAKVFQHEVEDLIAQWEGQYEALPDDVAAKSQEYLGAIASKSADIAKVILIYFLNKLGSFSTFLINFVVAIILAYFLSLEIDYWKRTANQKTPKTFKTAFSFLRENVLIGIGGYIKAQLKLITITFVIIFISLLLLGIDNAFSIALLSAFVDLLPLLGVSAVFIPWIVYLFIVGNTSLAIWLSILLLAVILFRQIFEPKITGDTLGVSAFTTLAFMVISLSLFGVAGLIISPILIILIKALYDQGYLKKWIHLPEDEYESNFVDQLQNKQE